MTEDSRLEDIMAEYRFLQIMETPWTNLPAYKMGILSVDGKILKRRNSLTETKEKLAYPDKFFTLSWTAKRLLEKFYQNCIQLDLDILGTMCLPPENQDPHIHFSKMKNLNDNIKLNELSMGMSSDYLTAVKYLSSYLRIGSKIFGARS